MDASSILLIKKNCNILYSIKKIFLKRVSNINNDYLYAFILGDSSHINSNIKESYSINGISHLFSISGMHITLIVTILCLILDKILINNKHLIILLFLFIYIFVTNYTPSIMRAFLIYALNCINKKLNLKLDIRHILLLICSICLFYNPFYIYNTGFLFSYIISYSLISYSSVINKYHNYFIKIFITSLIAFLFSIPILINNYHSINLLSPLINIIFVPLISLIIFPLSLLIFIIPKLSFIYNFFVFILEFLSKTISHIDYFNISLCNINMVSTMLYYLIIILIVNAFKSKNFKYLIFLLIIFFIHHNINYLTPFYKIIFLDVGQGDSILIIFPFNKGNVLIDAPTINNKEIGKDIIIPYLKSIGVYRINYLINTHGDNDHVGEFKYIINNYSVDNVIINCGVYNDLELNLISELDKRKIQYYSCIKELNIDKNKLYFLQTKVYDNENDNSNVIYTKIGNYKFLFMGDASITTEKEIIDKYNVSNIDVLKVGHHGSKTSSSKEFINILNPKYSIISVGKNNRYGHPNKEVLYNLKNSKIYRTDRDGSVMVKIKNNKLQIENCSL